jgi:gamma-glutamyltranspeptidase/glutathione hydrolase/leukotriene-C4 hydrolase
MGNTTGIIFNNEINDFSFPNKSDAYGLPSNPHNYVQPGISF